MCNYVLQNEMLKNDLPPDAKLADPGLFPPPQELIGPRDWARIITKEPEGLRTRMANFWFLPNFAKTASEAYKYSLLNARSEEIFEKPAYKGAIFQKRCLIPVNAFIEYTGTKTPKDPHYFFLRNGEPTYLAGIWNTWRPYRDPLRVNDENPWGGLSEPKDTDSFAILTTRANPLVAKYHPKQRMPVIVRPENLEAWLAEDLKKPEEISSFFRTFPESEMDVVHPGPMPELPGL